MTGHQTHPPKPFVEIYTDGACKGNPGPGGYGAILKFGERTKEISGCSPSTTNNRMEMKAVIEALRRLKKPCHLKIVTDSRYVMMGITSWLPGWLKRNWQNAQKKPVLNRDLWEELLRLSRSHHIQWAWVKGHDGHPENERCDELAKKALKDCL
jgi:ribonuclease HI